MDESERNRKLKAGREKFNQYLKKKTEDSKNGGVKKKSGIQTASESTAVLNELSTSSLSSEGTHFDSEMSASSEDDCVDEVEQKTQVPDNAEDTSLTSCSTVLQSELIDAESCTSGVLDLEFLSDPGISSHINAKIQEYEEGIRKRNDVIVKLTERLETTIAQLATVQLVSTKTEDALTVEVEVLKLQMQNANEFLKNQNGKNGVSAAELLEANNQIIALRHVIDKRNSDVETLSGQVANLSGNLHLLELESRASENTRKDVERQLGTLREELSDINLKNRDLLKSFTEVTEQCDDKIKLLHDREEEMTNLSIERQEIETQLRDRFENEARNREALFNQETKRLQNDYNCLEETFKKSEVQYGDVIKQLQRDIETSNMAMKDSKSDPIYDAQNFTKQINELEAKLSEWPAKLSQERENYEVQLEKAKNEVIMSHQLEMNTLKEENLTLQMEKEHLQIKRTEMESYESEANLLEQLQSELQSKNSTIDEHAGQIKTMESTLLSLTSDNDELRAAITGVQEELKLKSKEYVDLENKFFDMNKRFSELTVENDNILQSKDGLVEQLRLAVDQLNDEKQIKEKFNQELFNLKETFRNLEMKCYDQADQLLATQNNLKEVNSEKIGLHKTLDETRGMLTDANVNLKELKNMLNSERHVIDTFKVDTEIKIKELSDSIDKLKLENMEIEILKSDLESKKLSLEALQEQVTSLDQQHLASERRIASQTKRLEELLSSLDETNAEKLDAINRYEELKAEFETFKDTKSELSVNCAEIQVNLDDSASWEEKYHQLLQEKNELEISLQILPPDTEITSDTNYNLKPFASKTVPGTTNVSVVPNEDELPLYSKHDSCFGVLIDTLSRLISEIEQGSNFNSNSILNELYDLRQHIMTNTTDVNVMQKELEIVVNRSEKQNIRTKTFLPLESDPESGLQLRINKLELLLEEANNEKLKLVNACSELKVEVDLLRFDNSEAQINDAVNWKEKYYTLLDEKNQFHDQSSNDQHLLDLSSSKEDLPTNLEGRLNILLKFVSHMIEKVEIDKEWDLKLVVQMLHALRHHMTSMANVDALQKELEAVVNQQEMQNIKVHKFLPLEKDENAEILRQHLVMKVEDLVTEGNRCDAGFLTKIAIENEVVDGQTWKEKYDELLQENTLLKMEIQASQFNADGMLTLSGVTTNEDPTCKNSTVVTSHLIIDKINDLLGRVNIIDDGDLSFVVEELQELRQNLLTIFSVEELKKELMNSVEQMECENINVKNYQPLGLVDVDASSPQVEELKLALDRAESEKRQAIASLDELKGEFECLRSSVELKKQVPSIESVDGQVSVEDCSEKEELRQENQALEVGQFEDINWKEEYDKILQERVELEMQLHNTQLDTENTRESAYLYEETNAKSLETEISLHITTDTDNYESNIERLLVLIDQLLGKIGSWEDVKFVSVIHDIGVIRELIVKINEVHALQNELGRAVDQQETRNIRVQRVKPLGSDNSGAEVDKHFDNSIRLLVTDESTLKESLINRLMDDDSNQNQKETEEMLKLKKRIEDLEQQLIRKDDNIVCMRQELQAQYEEDVEQVRKCLEASLVQEVQADVDAEVDELTEKVDADIWARNMENVRFSLALQELKVQVEQLQRDKEQMERSLGGGGDPVLLADVNVNFDDDEDAQSFGVVSKIKWDATNDSDDTKLSGVQARRLLSYLLGIYVKMGKTINKELISLIGTDLGVCDVTVNADRSMQFADLALSEDAESSFVSTANEEYAFETAYENLVIETGSKLVVAVQRLLGMLSALVQQMQENPRASSTLNDETQSFFDERNEDLVAQLTDEARTKNFLGAELNKTIALLKTAELEKNKLKDELDRKEKQLAELICRLEETKTHNQKLEESLTEDESRSHVQQEHVIESLGESGQIIHSMPVENQCSQLTDNGTELLDENARLQREKRGLQHKVERERSELTARIRELEQTLEESTMAQEILQDIKRQEISDLQQQIDALEKQLRSNKHFIEEQTLEREQERDDFQKELEKLQEVAKEKDRAQNSEERLSREVETWQEQVKEKHELCKQLLEKKEQLEKDLEILLEKSKSDQDVIRDLERQLDCKSRSEKMLNEQMEKLQTDLDHSSRIHHDQSIEIEQLRKMSVSSQLNVSAAYYEEYFGGGHLDMDNPPSPESVVLELRSQVQNLEDKVSRHSLDLEGLLIVTSGLNSPCSEEVSVREQLEVLRSKEKERLLKSENVEPTFNAFLKDVRRLEEKVDSLSRSRDIVLKKLKDYEAQIVRQRQSEEELQQDRDMLQQKVNAQLLQITSLQSRIEKRRFGIEDEEMTARILELQDEIDKERQLVDCKTKQIEEFQECVTELQQQCNSHKKQVSELTQRYSNDLNMHKAAQTAAVAELNENKQKNDILKSDLLKTQKQLEDVSSLLQSVMQEKNKEIDMMSTEAQMLEKQNEELKRTADNLETKLSNAVKEQQQLADAQEIITKLTRDISEKDQKLNEDERELKKLSDVIEQKRREVEALKVVMEEKAELVEQVVTLRAEVEDLAQYQSRLQEDFDTVQSMLEDRQLELGLAQQEVSDLNADKNNLLQEIKVVKQQFDVSKADAETQIYISTDALNKLSEQDERIVSLSTEVKNLSSVKETLNERLKSEEKKVSSLSKKLKAVKNKFEESEANVKQLSTELEKSNEELKQTKDDLNKSLQLKSRLEAEISWRDTKIYRIEDELEHLKAVKSDGEGNAGKGNLYKFLEEVRQEVIRESENLNLSERDAESSDGFLDPFRPGIKPLRQRDDDRGSCSPGPSASSSDVESVTSEALPPPVRSLMRKVYKEGIHVLNLTELNAVQEQLPTDAPVEDMNRTIKHKTWAHEKRHLMAEIDALKELLTHITNVAAASRDVADSEFNVVPEVLRGVMKLLSNDRNAILEEIFEVFKNKNVKSDKLEKWISELMTMYTNVSHTIQNAVLRLRQVPSTLTDAKTVAWEVQMAVAKERLANQTEQKKLLNQLQTSENQLGFRERQMKRQAELLEFRVQQEQLIAEDLRRNLENEKSRCIELCSQLALERSRVAHMDLNISQLKGDLSASQMALDQEKQELYSTMQQLKNEKAMVESYVQALQTERANFTQLQEAMEAEKRRSKSSCQRDHQIKEELRQALITERDKQLELTTLLESERIALQTARQELMKAQSSRKFQTERHLSMSPHGSNDDNSSALAFERKKSMDLASALQREQHKVSILTSSLQQDRKQLLDELDGAKEFCARLQSTLEIIESQKTNLLKEVQRNREEIHRLELENEKFDSELRILQNNMYQKDQEVEQLRRVQREMSKDWDVERELERQKMQEAKHELRKLQQKVASYEREIEMIKRNEKLIESGVELDQQHKVKQPCYQPLRNDIGLSRIEMTNLETVRQRMGFLLLKIRDDVSTLLFNELPTAESFDKFSLHVKSLLLELDVFGQDLQRILPSEEGQAAHLDIMEKVVKHNAELSEFALRLSENKLSLREMVMRGKNELDSLKYTPGIFGVHPAASNISILSAERASWAQERTRLQQALHKAEADLIRASSKHLATISYMDQGDDIKVVRQKYLRAESFRKNLAFQKTYLLLLLAGYQYTESGTLDVLGRLGCLINSHSSGLAEHRHSRAFQRFRSAARLIGAIFRMKFLVRKWRRSNSNSHSCGTPIYDHFNDRFSASSSVSCTPSDHSQSRRFSFNSGFTPPVKDAPKCKMNEEKPSACKNLPFAPASLSSSGSSNISANGRLSEYVKRFDNIQQQLGIIVKQPSAME